MSSFDYKFEERPLKIQGFEVALVNGTARIAYSDDDWGVEAIYLTGSRDRLEGSVFIEPGNPLHDALRSELESDNAISDAVWDARDSEPCAIEAFKRRREYA